MPTAHAACRASRVLTRAHTCSPVLTCVQPYVLAGVFVRRAEFDDHAGILALVGEETHLVNKRYGTFEVTSLIESATLGISAVDEKGALIGYAAFFDYPALTPAVSQSHWPEWLHDNFGHDEYAASNVVWLSFLVTDHLSENEVQSCRCLTHLMVAFQPSQTSSAVAFTRSLTLSTNDHLHQHAPSTNNCSFLIVLSSHVAFSCLYKPTPPPPLVQVVENILRTAFTTLPDVDVILFVLPSDVRLFPPLRDTFEPLHCHLPDATDLRVFACPRGLYLPNLLIREARVEDHDDLVPVFNSQSEVLTERYGEFFIAELIESQDSCNRWRPTPSTHHPRLSASLPTMVLSDSRVCCNVQGARRRSRRPRHWPHEC